MREISKINIPEGKRIKYGTEIHAYEDDGCILVVYDLEDDYKPEKGDFIFIDSGDRLKYVGIYERNYIDEEDDSYIITSARCDINGNNLSVYNKECYPNYIRKATEDEKEILLDKMEQANRRYDEENKRVVDIVRNRLKQNFIYYYLTFEGIDPIITQAVEKDTVEDKKRFAQGNYFIDKVSASNAAMDIKKVLKAYRRKGNEEAVQISSAERQESHDGKRGL